MISLLRFTLILILLSGLNQPLLAENIPYFARLLSVSCSRCHVSPPKLNASGEAFRLNAYRMPDREKRPTVPVAVWISSRSEYVPDSEVEKIKNFVNRAELISGGTFARERLSYFVEWRALSFEKMQDGTLRDRSGRFEDLFLVVDLGGFAITAGQYRQIDQVDVSTRPGLSEPLALSASLPGFGDGTSRSRSLRGFAPSGRSPTIRVTRTGTRGSDWNWTNSISLPFPGEFSLPITREARRNASNEFEIDPKGIVFESFIRSRLNSYGGHVFIRSSDYYLVNAVVTGAYDTFYWTAIAGIDHAFDELRGRLSAEVLYAPSRFAAFGTRIEERTSDDRSLAAIPYVNLHFPGTRFTIRLTVEQRFQKRQNATVLELATIF